MSEGLWGPADLRPEMEIVHTVGTLTLHLRRTPEEIWIRTSHDAREGSERWGVVVGEPRAVADAAVLGSATPEEPGEWTRWGVEPGDALELRPSFPDRPLVVATEQPFFLPPEGRARVYVRIPLFVGVDLLGADGHRTVLESHPSVVLSDTWWGDHTEGELAYWLGTRARRQVSEGIFEPSLVICPFLLVNRSDQPLPVERFVVRVAYLTLFGRGDALWADEVQVRYEGDAESDIRYTGRVPEEAGRLHRIADSREEAPRSLKARMFGRLRGRSGVL